ncbi:MAG: ribosome-associated translation inhibitor RaiA [Candidatus Peregrinibacteria bacterium]
MSFMIHSANLNLTAEEEQYAQEKAEKLLHFSKQAETDASVKVKFEIDKYNGKDKTHQFMCTITVDIPGKVIHAESYGSGVYAVIDEAVKKAEIQVKKEKEKHLHI